jgi:N-acetylneuraminic acid mutarotase
MKTKFWVYCYLAIIGDIISTSETNAQWTTADLSVGRYKPMVATVGSKIFIAGGNDVDDYNNLINIYDTKTNTWTSHQVAETKRGVCGASLGSKVYFAGGYNTEGISTTMDIYDRTTNSWTSISIPYSVFALAVTSAGSKLFFAQGIPNVVDIYDSATNSWSTDSLSRGRSGLVTVSLGTKVFFAGGKNADGTFSNVVDIYDMGTHVWTATSLSRTGAYFAAATLGTKIFLAGGDNSTDVNNSNVSNVVDIYDTSSSTWTTDTLSQKRSGLAAVALGDKIFFAGGVTPSFWSAVVDIYDVSTHRWKVEALTDARTGLSAASAGTKAVFAGGHFGTSSSGVVDIYNSNCELPLAIKVSPSIDICAGSSTVIKASGVYTYNWTPSIGLSSVTDSIVTANPIENTTYTVTGTDVNGCLNTNIAMVTIGIYPVNKISLDPSGFICKGDSITLSATQDLAQAFKWKPSSDLSDTTGQIVTATPMASTTYTVTITDIHSCVTKDSVTVVVSPLPPKPTITGDQLNTPTPVLTSSSSTGNQWYKDGASLPGATNQILTVSERGAYSVQIRLNNCLGPFSDPFPIVITGMEDVAGTGSTVVYPNPAENILAIQWLGFNSEKQIEVKILDMLGRPALHATMSMEEKTLDIGDLVKGVYIFQASQGRVVQIKRIIKK